jgi:hypothetical protein
MALLKSYLTVNGKIRSEQRSGESGSRDYVLDGSGSVVGVYRNGWLQADACYEPYGSIYTQWYMGTDGYRFTWGGGFGYRQTFTEWSSVYVRARHYSKAVGSWLSVDPLWPSEMPYGYVEGRVPGSVDYWGMQTDPNNPCPDLCNKINSIKPGTTNYGKIQECMKKQGFSLQNDDSRVRKAIEDMGRSCPPNATQEIRLIFADRNGNVANDPGWPCDFGTPCMKTGVVAGALSGKDPNSAPTPPVGEKPCPSGPCNQAIRDAGFSCAIVVCVPILDQDELCDALMHELIHCAGFSGSPNHNKPDRSDFVYNLGCCISASTGGSLKGCKHRFSWLANIKRGL